MKSDNKGEKEKETAKERPDLGEGERVYVLKYMFVTFPTCQVERSPLKAAASANTAPHSNKEKSKDKNG